MKRCVAIQHVAFENLGVFVQPLEEAGFAISYVQAGVVPLEPELWKDADLAVVLGGPIGVYQEDLYPFLTDEKALVASRLASGRPLLGVCLGAQLMASALDADVYPGTAKEIGWGQVELTPAGLSGPLAELVGAPVLHWHAEFYPTAMGTATEFALSLGATPVERPMPDVKEARCVGASFSSFLPECAMGCVGLRLSWHSGGIVIRAAQDMRRQVRPTREACLRYQWVPVEMC